MVASAPQNDDNSSDCCGSAYIFAWDGAEWFQTAKLLASDVAPYDTFGYSVAISDQIMVVDANHDNDNGESSGSAYIFAWDGAKWSQTAKLLASDVASHDTFGYSIGISDQAVVAGANGDDDKGDGSGSAYIFV